MTDPTAELLLLHAPADVASASVMLLPSHTESLPVILAAGASTVISIVSRVVPQLLVTVYDMMAVPAVAPVTMPVADTDATAELLLVHEPFSVASARVMLLPVHTDPVPVIFAAGTSTVTIMVSLAAPHELLLV